MPANGCLNDWRPGPPAEPRSNDDIASSDDERVMSLVEKALVRPEDDRGAFRPRSMRGRRVFV